jgi:hypothetical protein
VHIYKEAPQKEGKQTSLVKKSKKDPKEHEERDQVPLASTSPPTKMLHDSRHATTGEQRHLGQRSG